MPKNLYLCLLKFLFTKLNLYFTGKGGKNRRRGKNENETEKRELVFREDGQGIISLLVLFLK